MLLQLRRLSHRRVFPELLGGLFFVVASLSLLAQSDSATLRGTVLDSTGAVLVGAVVQASNSDTNTTVSNVTNREGIYVIPFLKPGRYRVRVNAPDFKQVVATGITLNVQEMATRDFILEPGPVSESVTVNAENNHIDTTDATVSTVVDQEFLQEIPLNGRTLQTLLLLTPGVNFTEGGVANSQGQFSVNGMRTDSNYFTIDGIAANIGTDQVANGLGEAAAGSVPGWNAWGGTNGLVSVDTIQEFRVQTSSFAPEYGRTPGGQVGIVTRSGTNSWHGTAFDYLRNDLFDANDWFADHNNLPKAEERQNVFGGVVGGPISKDKTFFFLSYEGLRLRLPKVLESLVPDAIARSSAPSDLQPFLNAFPQPNGPEAIDSLAQFNAGVSSPVSSDAYSIRLDQSLGGQFRIFARYAYSPSSTASAGSPGSNTGFTPNNTYKLWVTIHTATVGLDAAITDRIHDELRLNYSNLKSYSDSELSPMGGAVPLTKKGLSQVYPKGVNADTSQFGFFLDDGSVYEIGSGGVSEQRQINVADTVSIVKGSHVFRFGADYRWLAPFNDNVPYSLDLDFAGINGPGGVLSSQTSFASVSSRQSVAIRSTNFSLFGQDTWKASSRLTVTYGLRWELNPAPRGARLADDPVVVNGLNNPASLSLAPRGTPFYATTYGNFAPRIGIAYKLFGEQANETVVRAGFGVFYDIGAGSLGFYTLGYPFSASTFLPDANYPLTPQELAPPTVDLSARPIDSIYVAQSNLSLPRTYQWNVALERGLGQRQSVKLTYLGTLGRDFLRDYILSSPNPEFTIVTVSNNQGASNYQAFQAQFDRQVTHGLKVLASYTWSHSLDNASEDWSGHSPIALFHDNLSIDRGNSDFDSRHSASCALTYDVPAHWGKPKLQTLVGGWSLENLITARTAFPVDLNPFLEFSGPYVFSARPNVVPGKPFYLYGSQYPGGRAFNPAAFSEPDSGTQGDLARNTLRGFGVWQYNLAIHRTFVLNEKVNLQFRAEAFNVFNHPNFADPFGFWPLDFPEFGQSTLTVASAASFGGLSEMYGVGGPRSLQFGLKLQF